jgi:chromosome segregation protein
VRLTKLELNGFKSFADQTELSFDHGVTAIVGPNGCGKSNVSDAVRWVLGEQRARALRGAKMEEVIFQGSSARRPVNIAEVSLHFENDDGSMELPFREVVITRRLSRSGESEYLLNRAPCRLRDIHDLLRGTGLGAEAGVVIESKMVDALLSDRADDRRELFEEAAGVSLYRDRKRTTERRLEETAADIARLDDLLGEVQSQVRSLARQRRKTERHAELSDRRFTVEIALAAREMAAWKGELAELEEKLARLRGASPGLHAAVEAAEQARDRAYGVRGAAEGQRAELAKLVADERQATHELRAEIAVAEERQRNALARRERAELERREGGEAAARLAADRDRAVAERATHEDRLRAAAEALQRAVGEEDETRGALAAARAAMDAAEVRVRETVEARHRLALDSESAQRQVEELTERQAAMVADEGAARAATGEAQRAMDVAAEEVRAARERAGDAARDAETANLALVAARDAELTAREELHQLEEELVAAEGKLRALESLEHERVGVAPAAARLLHERETFGPGAVLGALSDFISADSAAATLVERYLGSSLHAVVVRDAETAAAVREWHRRTQPGALLVLPLDALDKGAEKDGGQQGGVEQGGVEQGGVEQGGVEQGGVEQGGVEQGSETHGGEVLADVRTDSAGGRWARALLERVRALDEGTAFVDTRGAIWLPGPLTGPGPLRRRAEVADLRTRLDSHRTVHERAASAATERHAATAAAEAAASTAAQRSAELMRLLRHSEDQQSEAARRHQRSMRDLEDVAAARQRIEDRRDELAARISATATQLEAYGERIAEREGDLQRTRDEVAAATRRQEEMRDARTNAQVQKAQVDAHLQVATDRERHLVEEYTSAATRLTTLLSELSHLSDADAQLAQQVEAWRADLAAREATLHDAEERLAAAEVAVRTADEALIAAEKGRMDARQKATEAHDALHAAEVRYTELSGRRAAIRERLEAEWRKPLDDLLANAEPLEVSDDELRAEATSLREQLDAIGPVNALAIEEHEEEQKRLEFLTSQRDDLAAARLSLQQAVKEIDATARELFLSTFVRVREHFRQLFLSLFGGGECDLRLENPDAPLEGDIEVHASPRGKRTQRIHMLSTGERSLVALSLLFGIFLTKPSPFCVLDEVDAPLDDVNIGRFVRMLNEFKRRTQFIIITHNPRTTTDAADAVYGVTMQEPGVSSLVSVRLRGSPPAPAAESSAGAAGVTAAPASDAAPLTSALAT